MCLTLRDQNTDRMKNFIKRTMILLVFEKYFFLHYFYNFIALCIEHKCVADGRKRSNTKKIALQYCTTTAPKIQIAILFSSCMY